jgi:hypothetical protein
MIRDNTEHIKTNLQCIQETVDMCVRRFDEFSRESLMEDLSYMSQRIGDIRTLIVAERQFL